MGENRNNKNSDRRSNGKRKPKPTEQELRDRLTRDIDKLVTDNGWV
jgi:hypothetical protein